MSQWAVATMDEKGRVTVPEALMKEMDLENTARIVVRRDNNIMIMMFETSGPEVTCRELFEMDGDDIDISEEEIVAEVRAYRKEKKAGMVD